MAGGGANEPNLTPFIDLFSVLICFLLMTAAWIQLESMQVSIEKKPMLNPDMASDVPPPPEEPKKPETKLALHLKLNQILAKENELERVIPVSGLGVDTPQLSALLTDWRARFGEKQVLVIHAGDKATYGQLIRLYDVVIRSGWPEVGINPY